MADKRIKDLTNTATSSTLSADQYAVVDGSTGTFKTKLSELATWIHGRWASFVNALTAKTSFASGDKIVVVNGSTATAMSKDDLLKETAQKALAGNVAHAFDPTRDEDHKYLAGESVAYNGKTYTFKVDHYGAWSDSDVYREGDVVNTVNSNAKHILEIQEEINEKGEFTEISDSFTKLFDGFIGASTGIVYSYQTNAYQIKYILFANDSFVKVARSVASAENANVLLVVDNIAKVFVGADVSKYIVDKGTANPFEGTFFVPAGSYFVWGWQSGSASNTTISSADAVKLKTLVNNLVEDVAQIEQDISYYEAVENIAVNTLTLSSAYINGSGQVKSWSNPNYNIFSYQAQTEEYVKIKRTESVYVNNDVICKCATISGIAVDNYIDGEVLCTGSDYPFETIVHLNAGEYIVRSGTTGADNSVFTKLEKKLVKDKLLPLEGLKVDFEGDSIMAGNGGGGGWPSLIATNEKVVATNNGASGYKIAGILANVKSRTPSNYDMIVVQGGFNDGTTTLGTFDRDDYRDEGAGDYDQSTFYGAMEILCRYCLVTFSKAMFIVGYNWGNDTWNTTLANACVEVCEKWGMPYVDLRSKAGFNLHVLSLRKKYGVYIGDVAAYDPTAGYSLDDQAKNDGKVYKANQNIPSPAGAFDASKWTYIRMEYDQCHCNEDGYKKSVGAIVEMMKSL